MKNVVFWDIMHLAFVRTDVSEECIVSIIEVTKIGELGTTLAIISNRSTLRRNIISIASSINRLGSVAETYCISCEV
jgi:hypothetical protein